MPALDQSALLMEVGNIWVGDNDGNAVDLGAVRNVQFTGKLVRTKIDSDNRGTIVNKVRMEGQISFNWLEPGDAAKIENLFKGIVTLSSTAGSLVSGATQVVASPLVPNEWTEITGQNASGLQPTINSVTGSVDGALTLNDDFHIVKNPNTGKWGIIFNTVAIGPTLTTLVQTATINYDYTPAANLILTGGTNQTATARYVKIVGPSEDDSNLTRNVVLAAATASSDMVLAFVDVETAGDVGVMPVTMESNKGTAWTYTDEVNPT